LIIPCAEPKKESLKLDEFDEKLLSTIDEVLQYTLGEVCTQVIYNYLERDYFPKSEIPTKLDRFSEELRKLLGDGKGQILGSAPILEEAIAERLCAKLGMPTPGRLPMAFSIFIRKLKDNYFSKRKETAVSVIDSAVTEEAELR
jgi:hypothetical protein